MKLWKENAFMTSNGSQRRVILEAYKIATFFRRMASRFGWHSRIFFEGEEIDYLHFLRGL
jgi:hypothetical protein